MITPSTENQNQNYAKIFEDLEFLKTLDLEFLAFLNTSSPENYEILLSKRGKGGGLSSSEIIVFSSLVEEFLIKFFKISLVDYQKSFSQFQKLANVKREFVQRKVGTRYKDFEGKEEELPKFNSEIEFAELVLQNPSDESLINYTRFALFTENGKTKHAKGMLFKLPRKVALPWESVHGDIEYNALPPNFNKSKMEAMWETKYCIYCHKQEKDYCRKDNPIAKKNGCPLRQKISEMNLLKVEGGIISPLVCLMMDNPLCILTGTRICNDCKRACIFQKQEGVDVPAIESQILTDVLNLPFGFEIYVLLTKWNPLIEDFLPKPYNGQKILVCGAGPAGIASAYYLLREGYGITMIDGMKIYPIPNSLLTEPIKDVNTILKDENRKPSGFGGVMEYGITERWNKNFLTFAQSLLERNEKFEIYGNKRFGSDVTVKTAKDAGFVHIFMCIGAGNPLTLNIKGKEASGVFTASNILMSAHLQREWTKQNVKSPVLVIGAGLTAIDVSMESYRILKHNNEPADVSIFYRGNLEFSSGYKLNDAEVEEAMATGIKFYENKIPTEILEKDGIACGLKFEDGTAISGKTIIFAIGTVPNLGPIQGESSNVNEHHRRKFYEKDEQRIDLGQALTIFGDLNEDYSGSVVKAIANVKDRYKDIIQDLIPFQDSIPSKNSPSKDSRKIILTHKVVEIQENEGFLLLKVRASFEVNARVLNVFKLQCLENSFHPIALTLFEIDRNDLTFYVKIIGNGTRFLLNLKENQDICLMKAADNLDSLPDFQIVYVDTKEFLVPLSKTFKDVRLLQDFEESDKSTLFYVQDVSSIPKRINHFVFLFTEMHCMLSGVCSRCLSYSKNGEKYFACSKNIINSILY